MLRDDDVLSEVSGDPTLAHGQRLPGDLDRALAAAGVALDQVALLAVVAGPGSFTGLRIGIATMQGLAFSRGLTVVPVSALDAMGRLTRRTAGDGVLVAVWIDAQRGEVFAALYDGGVGRPLVAASSAPPAATLEAWVAALGSRPVVFAGDGAVRYREVIVRTLGARATVREPPPALAAEAARIALEHPERAVAPHGIVPIYVRRPDVELTRESSSR